ncbi:hypothetical protein LTR48_002425 [Friedmanniomyces endolithicus]|uniref:Rhodopsin domain-containing protein n=1 Tax=Rachicladosporium monterosium TaxID=1507873 RepID=A0ABR0L723_9PEZI|nr:hypothetical protein LTR29_002344 [Friedmanniomyces endolithicus]KAK1093388.1 hypothetical protein LTR48_002425 [Friedmanniomyces endolithicus]KAK5144486.1 hypothetical protein LTR32_003593 [Rachicladosporium monterosium]
MSTSSSRITASDHGAKLVLGGALMLAYTVLLLVVRLHSRWPWNSSLRREDFLLLGATVASIGYTAAICISINHGLGQHIDLIAISEQQKIKTALLVSCVFFFVAEGLAIVSYGMFIQSLAADRTHRLASTLGHGCATVWSLAGAIAALVATAERIPPSVSQQDYLEAQWTTPLTHEQKVTWITLGCIEAILLVLWFLLSSRMVWTAQMHWWRKLKASMWFSLGLILVGFITARLYYTPNQLFSSDFTFNALDLFVLLTIEMHLMIMNAAYPNLLAFLSKTGTGFMNTAQTGTTSGSHNANGRSESSRHHVKLRNDATSHATVVANRAQDATSVKSFNSQQIMISKSVMVRDDAGGGDRNESSSYRGTKD